MVYFRGKTKGIDIKETIPNTRIADISRLSDSKIEKGAMNLPNCETN
jgi:hypothetical protein